MLHPIPIGIDDFRTLRQSRLEYVDKSDLIRQLLDRSGVQVVLLPRPRRFGKTLNLSMLRAWFEKRDEDAAALFEGLSIWQAGETYRCHFQRYPIIHFNFKGTKASSFADCWGAVTRNIEAVFREHLYLLKSDRLDEWQIRDFRSILDRSADRALYARGLLDLSGYLHAHHGEKVVIL
ncbi:MAG: AAA family ATPase, partial [Minicystis sp.]